MTKATKKTQRWWWWWWAIRSLLDFPSFWWRKIYHRMHMLFSRGEIVGGNYSPWIRFWRYISIGRVSSLPATQFRLFSCHAPNFRHLFYCTQKKTTSYSEQQQQQQQLFTPTPKESKKNVNKPNTQPDMNDPFDPFHPLSFSPFESRLISIHFDFHRT